MQNPKHTQKEMASPSEVALQKEGFSFSFAASACALCGGRCCVGESGYIFLSLAEAQRIAEFLNIAFEDFALKFLKKRRFSFPSFSLFAISFPPKRLFCFFVWGTFFAEFAIFCYF